MDSQMAPSPNSNGTLMWQHSIDERVSHLEANNIDTKVELAECNTNLKSIDERLKTVNDSIIGINKNFSQGFNALTEKVSKHSEKISNLEQKDFDLKLKKRWLKNLLITAALSLAGSGLTLLVEHFTK